MKRKQRKTLLDALAIIIIVLAVVAIYFGMRFSLSTSVPLVVVASGSMRPTLQVGDLVIVQGVPASKIKVGDIIVFNQPGETTNTIHRVVAIETLTNGTIEFRTKGDANPTDDPNWTPEQNVKGRVLYHIPYLGYLALIPAIPIVMIIIIIIIVLALPEKPKKFHHKSVAQ